MEYIQVLPVLLPWLLVWHLGILRGSCRTLPHWTPSFQSASGDQVLTVLSSPLKTRFWAPSVSSTTHGSGTYGPVIPCGDQRSIITTKLCVSLVNRDAQPGGNIVRPDSQPSGTQKDCTAILCSSSPSCPNTCWEGPWGKDGKNFPLAISNRWRSSTWCVTRLFRAYTSQFSFWTTGVLCKEVRGTHNSTLKWSLYDFHSLWGLSLIIRTSRSIHCWEDTPGRPPWLTNSARTNRTLLSCQLCRKVALH